MDYIPHTEADIKQLFTTVGIKDIAELFRDIPKDKVASPMTVVPGPEDELSLVRELTERASKNTAPRTTFMGGGAYDHFIPSVVNAILSRSEFYTAYTPYQPEISQGMLRAIYEYQSMVCALTGMDVSNASVYDGASAIAEASYMAVNFTRRKKVLVPASVNPHYRQVLKTYSSDVYQVVEAPMKNGLADTEWIIKNIDEATAAVIVQQPNFLGCLEDVNAISAAAKGKGSLLIASVYPISLGVLKSPAEYGASIVTGEGQCLGNPLNYGGPYLGIFSAKKELARYMPGRIVGKTVDKNGKEGYVLTLQTREQHIKREKATSNICSNQALCALAAAVYMSSVGRNGFKRISETCHERAQYAKQLISRQKGLEVMFNSPTYNEFAVKLQSDHKKAYETLKKKGIRGGIDLGKYYPELEGAMLLAFTEKNTEEDIDLLVRTLSDH